MRDLQDAVGAPKAETESHDSADVAAGHFQLARFESVESGSIPVEPDGFAPYLPKTKRAPSLRNISTQGKLGRYYAGRELRVRAPELVRLMATPRAATDASDGERSSPEREAEQYLARRRRRQ